MNPNGTDGPDRSTDVDADRGPDPRYLELSVGDDELVIHDPDNHDAWVHSTLAIDVVGHR
jgi:hypothetical protein